MYLLTVKGVFTRSKPLFLTLTDKPVGASMKAELSAILKKLIGMICFQKSEVNKIPIDSSKRVRTFTDSHSSSSAVK